VRMGLAAIEDADLIAVHDAARPFVTADAVARVIAAAAEAGGAILALPASDTVKEVDEAREIRATLDRRRLWLAQTPQVFRLDLLRAAHARAQLDRLTATDDAALVERLGVGVRVVPCDSSNRKITTPEDLLWAEWQLARGRAPR
jgi:2-C-methyl-D-erythritol 4-phosphate cytidylyltransferase